MRNKLLSVLLWIWQLPQNLLGLFLIWIYKAKEQRYVDFPSYWTSPKITFGVSLGQYILLHDNPSDEVNINHEHGHSLQSRVLGPLYLVVVGVPSAVFNNWWDRVFHKKWDPLRRYKWYYGRWPEGCYKRTWWQRFTADVLGGVARYG